MWRRNDEAVAVHRQAVVKSILRRVWETGDIYKAKYEGDRPPQLFSRHSELCHLQPLGASRPALATDTHAQLLCLCLISRAWRAGWYCVGCEAYKDDSEMDGDHVCPTHKKRCVEREEENYFFALSKYQNQIQVCPISSGVHTLRRKPCACAAPPNSSIHTGMSTLDGGEEPSWNGCMPHAGADRGGGLCAARGPAQRDAWVGESGAQRLLYKPRSRCLGHPNPSGPQPDRVCLVRCPSGVHVRYASKSLTVCIIAGGWFVQPDVECLL